MDIEKEFDQDYDFFVKLREKHRQMIFTDYEKDNERLLEIAQKYKNVLTEDGKYFWLMGSCWVLLQKAQYRLSAIDCFEKYLKLLPFEAEIKVTPIYIYRHFGTKQPETPEEFAFAKKIHFQNVYYDLAKLYEKENDTVNAFKCIQNGINLLPNYQFVFYYVLYDVCRKSNDLPLFLTYCERLTAQERKEIDNMICRAKELIARNYVFKPRRSKK